jgi:serine phosphatase RsbU (regulator of sigma subunit)
MSSNRIPVWMVLLAVSFIANFLYAGVYLQLWGMPSIGIEVQSSGDSISVWKVESGSPAESAGAAAGDIVRSFNGRPMRQLNDYLITEQLISHGALTRLTIEREGRLLDLQIATGGSYFTSVSPVNRLAIIFWILIGILEFVLASILAFGRPSDRSVLCAALFLAVLTTLNTQSAGFATAFRALPFALKVLIYPVPLLSLEILFFAFLFCANFPRPIFKEKRAWLLSSMPAAAIFLYVALLNLPMSFGSHPELLFQVGVGIYFDFIKIPMLVILCGYAIAAVVAIIINYRRCDRVERRRIKLMLVGALIGLSSVVPAAIIHDLIYSDLISRSGFISIAFGALRIIFLACFVYAVLRQKVFEIPVLLRRSGRYLLVQRGYLFVLAIGGVLITAAFARVLSRNFPAEADLSVPIGAAFGMLLVWVGTVVHTRVQVRLDRIFFRSAYDAQQILEDMAEKSRRATSRAELAEVLRVRIYQALQPTQIAVLLESSPGRLELFSESGQPPIIIDAKGSALAALAKSGRARELESKDWDSGALKGLSQLRPECLVPMVGRAEGLRGLLALGPKLSEEPYSTDDLRLLQSAAAQAGVALENISLAEDIAERLQAERLAEHELQIARSVQSRLLPGSAPVLTSLNCVGRCIQAKQVGGDFYDFLEYGPGKVGLVLADIAGKGMSAALLMANLQAQLRSHRVVDPGDIEEALASVNSLFRKSIEVGGFATLFLGFYDDASNVLTYANCGHAPPVVMRSNGLVHRLEATATVLGAFADWDCNVEEVKIEEGDVLVLYSDGITEAENENGEQFGEARLLELLHGCRGLSADQLLEAIIGSVLDFSHDEQLDDITLVVAQSKSVPKIRQQEASSSHPTQR